MEKDRKLRDRTKDIIYKATVKKTSSTSSSTYGKSKSTVAEPINQAKANNKVQPTSANNSSTNRTSITTASRSLTNRTPITSNNTRTPTNNVPLDKRRSTVGSTINPLAERFSKLEAKIVEIDRWYTQLKVDYDNLKEDNESLQCALALLSGLESKVDEAEENYNHLRSENEVLHSTLLELKSEVTGLNKEIQRLNEAEAQLNLNLKNCEDKISKLTSSHNSTITGISSEQHQLNTNIIIRGIDLGEDPTEADILAVYNGIRSHLGILEIVELDPVRAIRLPSVRGKAKIPSNRPLQVQLTSIAAKRQFLQVRRVKKEIFTSDIGVQQQLKKPILITEQLTHSNQELLYQARSLRSGNNYKFIWSNNGQILARYRQESKVIRITDTIHVNKLRKELKLDPIAENGRHNSSSSI